MELAAIITAIVINTVGVGGIVFYAGRKVGTICTRVDTCSKNIGDLTTALNKINTRVQEVEITMKAFYKTRLQSGEKPNHG